MGRHPPSKQVLNSNGGGAFATHLDKHDIARSEALPNLNLFVLGRSADRFAARGKALPSDRPPAARPLEGLMAKLGYVRRLVAWQGLANQSICSHGPRVTTAGHDLNNHMRVRFHRSDQPVAGVRGCRLPSDRRSLGIARPRTTDHFARLRQVPPPVACQLDRLDMYSSSAILFVRVLRVPWLVFIS